MNLFEQLTPEAKFKIESTRHEGIKNAVVKELSKTENYFDLNLGCILHLNILNVLNSYNPSDVKQIFKNQ